MNKTKIMESQPYHRWWLEWLISFVASLVTPAVFYWWNIEEIVEPLRYSSGWNPLELLLLHYLKTFSCWIPGILILLLIRAIFKPSSRRTLICFGAVFTAIFSSLYTACCLLVISMYLIGCAQDLQREKADQESVANISQREALKSAP